MIFCAGRKYTMTSQSFRGMFNFFFFLLSSFPLIAFDLYPLGSQTPAASNFPFPKLVKLSHRSHETHGIRYVSI